MRIRMATIQQCLVASLRRVPLAAFPPVQTTDAVSSRREVNYRAHWRTSRQWHPRVIVFVGLWIFLTIAPQLRADEQFFLDRVAPVLERRCVRCHNGDNAKGGLDLSTAKGLHEGGDSGEVLAAAVEESLLLEMVTGDDPAMPEGGPPLTQEQIADLRQWIKSGAHWPEAKFLQPKPGDGDWWSLRPLAKPPVPQMTSPWIRTPVDAFILERLTQKKLTPNQEADRRTLIRRLTFDLHGLPPTQEEIDAFVADSDPAAYDKLVDRLLASPRYGERWARHWLDVVHYGDTHGYDKDKRRPNAWPYRDYVIRSLNDDKPYAQFVREQLAGDVLFPGEPDGIIATGFVVAGPWDFVGHVELREGTLDKTITRNLDRDDMVTNTMATFCSLTVHCARCHDHKFDPITQADYYSLQAVFAGIDRAPRPYKIDAEVEAERAKLTAERNDLRAKINTAKKAKTDVAELEKQLAPIGAALAKLPKPPLVYAAATNFPNTGSFRPTGGQPREIHLLNRGSEKQPGEIMQPGTVGCIPGLPSRFQLDNPDDEGARRVQLAAWITDVKNPLTWRSIVNRVWHYHFGSAIVDSPNDFGHMGATPTHPELLDWLAADFRDNGQSLKRLHKQIVTSAAYRQSTAHDEQNAKIDSGNQFLWRMNRRQLEAEALRDAVLATSGKLDTTMYGPGFDLFGFIDDHSPHYLYDKYDPDDPRGLRRSIYRFIVRSVPDPFMETLDCADPSQNVPVRNSTVTALQALSLLNNKFMVRQAEHFAARAQAQAKGLPAQIAFAFQTALGRAPSEQESQTLTAYAEQHGLANACRLLFNANEFLFVD